MKIKGFARAAILGILTTGSAFAQDGGLVIHATEIGVGKFHRQDNKVHPYAVGNAWLPFVLPDQASAPDGSIPAPVTPIVMNNADGSITVFFSTLDELISSVDQISDSRGQLVELLNVHGHGLPGTMWFPATEEAKQSPDCSPWLSAAQGPDMDNYNQYYSPVSADEISEIQSFGDSPQLTLPCTTGYSEWAAEVAKNPHFVQIFASDAQIHFLSCVVGLGGVGEDFTRSLATLLLGNHSPDGSIETSLDLGLSDWSMPEGMGFWDMDKTSDQLNHANAIYPVDHQDAEVADTGTIRVASGAEAYSDFGMTVTWATGLRANVSFMLASYDLQPAPATAAPTSGTSTSGQGSGPSFGPPSGRPPVGVRIPGTTIRLPTRVR